MLEIVGQTAQAAVGLCFGYAAVSKLIWFRAFEAAITRFDVVIASLVRPAALTVVALEFLVALSFLANQLRLWGAVVAGILLLVFSTVVLSSRRRGIVAACMCFGPDALPSTAKTFVRIGFLGVGVAILVFDEVMGVNAGWVPRVDNVHRGGLRCSDLRDPGGNSRGTRRGGTSLALLVIESATVSRAWTRFVRLEVSPKSRWSCWRSVVRMVLGGTMRRC